MRAGHGAAQQNQCTCCSKKSPGLVRGKLAATCWLGAVAHMLCDGQSGYARFIGAIAAKVVPDPAAPTHPFALAMAHVVTSSVV